MMRFSAEAVDDPIWGMACSRVGDVIDGAHCGSQAYNNITHFIEPQINEITDLTIQTIISAQVQNKDIYDRIRVAVDKNFT